MSTVANKVFIPASLKENNQEIIISRPWYLRAEGVTPTKQSPAILQFRSDEFMDDFFDGVKKSANGESQKAFEELIAMRDYSEVPRSITSVTGKGIFPQNLLKRDETPANNLETKNSEINKDWLRKLYLSVHEHFHLVAFELSCEQQGYPAVDTKRIIDSGIIVRRLIPDKNSERWEDWFKINNEQGIWFEVSDAKMEGIVPDDIILSMPPSCLANFCFLSGLTANQEAPIPLEYEKLAFIPDTFMPNKKYTSLFGYLSLSSGLNQKTFSNQNFEDVLVNLKEVIKTKLEAIWLGPNVNPPFNFVTKNKLLVNTLTKDLLDKTVLPAQVFTNFHAELSAAGTTRELLVESIWQFLQSSTTSPGSDWGLNKSDWLIKFRDFVLGKLAIQGVSQLDKRNKISSLITLWMYTQIDGIDTPDNKLLSTESYLLLIITLIRIRYLRFKLLKQLYSALSDNPELDEKISVESLGEKIETFFSINQTNNNPVTPDLTGFSECKDVHTANLKLESFYQLRPLQSSGTGFTQYIEEKIVEVSQQIKGDTNFGQIGFLYNNFNLNPTDIPELGLLFYPGSVLTRTNINTTISAVLDMYDVSAPSPLQNNIKLEARNLLNLVRPRYDSSSLYCVQCFIKIAGRNPCEKDKIIWSKRTEPFSIAEPTDILGVRPVAMQLPDIKKLIRDIPRIPKARANPFASVNIPPDSDVNVNADDMKDVSRKMGIQMICSFGIPVFTICAWILFTIILNILLLIPGFAWMLLLKFCIPVPTRK